jgi:imidazolonepropionase-like amidohydrolase
MNRERDFGGVTVGGLADLVLLDANPLDDIRNAERIDAVVVAGRLLGKSALASLLRSAADSAERH